MFPLLWQAKAATAVLLGLVPAAGSRLVRVWAMTLLRRDHAAHLSGIAVTELFKLMEHDDPEVQQFGAEVLESAADLAHLPVATWLLLLRTRNITALETVARLLARHVTPERLDVAQCVALATAEPVPVARLGLSFLKAKTVRKNQLDALALLSRTRCAGLGQDVAAYALGVLGSKENYDADVVVRFFDSLTATVRQGAWAWLTPESAGYNDPALWSRLIETPYDDLRMALVTALRQRVSLPGADADRLAGVWCPLLLNIHRGGRHKLVALRQVGDAIRDDPAAPNASCR